MTPEQKERNLAILQQLRESPSPLRTAPVRDAYFGIDMSRIELTLGELFMGTPYGSKSPDKTTVADVHKAVMMYYEDRFVKGCLIGPNNPLITEQPQYKFNKINYPKEKYMFKEIKLSNDNKGLPSEGYYIICYNDEDDKQKWDIPRTDDYNFLTDYHDVEKWVRENMSPSDRNFLIAKVKGFKKIEVEDVK